MALVGGLPRVRSMPGPLLNQAVLLEYSVVLKLDFDQGGFHTPWGWVPTRALFLTAPIIVRSEPDDGPCAHAEKPSFFKGFPT